MSVALRNVRIVRDAFVLEIDAELSARSTAVLGPSGCGKTTLLECIAGLVRPARGRVEIGGQAVSDAATGLFVPARRRHVGYVPQDGALFPHLSVQANLEYGTHGEAPEALDRVARVLGIEGLLARRVPSLSGGEKRRVALGRALLAGSRLLLLDEPLTGLDKRLKARAIELLARVRDEFGVPLVLVTHDDAEAEALAEQVLRLAGE